MEKADCTLLDEIYKRKQKRHPYSSEDLFKIWKTIINVFAYCSLCGICHSDIKPSNILLIKNAEAPGGYTCKISDFGTSMSLSETKNIQLNSKDNIFTNNNKFMTPLYASPNICQKADKVNYYLEDVFSLGVTFLQMAGPYSTDELATFTLNASHQRLDMSINKCQSKLTYFLKKVLMKMLAYDADERPSFVELKEIFEQPQLDLNFENEAFIDAMIKDKIIDKTASKNDVFQNS